MEDGRTAAKHWEEFHKWRYGSNRIKEAQDFIWHLGWWNLADIYERPEMVTEEGKKLCITLLRKAQVHIGNILRENSISVEGL